MFDRGKALTAIVTAGVLGFAAVLPARADTDAEKIATVRQMLDAWHELDWGRVCALFAEDGVLANMMIEPFVGRDAICQHLQPLLAGISRIDLNVEHIGVIDGRVFVERVDDFTYNGHRGAVPVVGVLEVRGGHVQSWREYYDRGQLQKAMGVEPTAAQH
jgi:limonene-1,2-epoxide hydrolase